MVGFDSVMATRQLPSTHHDTQHLSMLFIDMRWETIHPVTQVLLTIAHSVCGTCYQWIEVLLLSAYIHKVCLRKTSQ